MSSIKVDTHLKDGNQIIQTVTFDDGETSSIAHDVMYMKSNQFEQLMQGLGWIGPTTAKKLMSVCRAIDESTCRNLTEEELADGTCDVPFKLIDTLVNIIDGMEKK